MFLHNYGKPSKPLSPSPFPSPSCSPPPSRRPPSLLPLPLHFPFCFPPSLYRISWILDYKTNLAFSQGANIGWRKFLLPQNTWQTTSLHLLPMFAVKPLTSPSASQSSQCRLRGSDLISAWSSHCAISIQPWPPCVKSGPPWVYSPARVSRFWFPQLTMSHHPGLSSQIEASSCLASLLCTVPLWQRHCLSGISSLSQLFLLR